MARRMGELRRLLAEYNSLVPLAQARGIRVRTRSHFHLDRVEARARVAALRASVAPFFTPSMSGGLDSNDTYATEIECYMPRGMTRADLARHLQADGIMAQEESLNHTVRTTWKLVTDGSLRDYGTGCEVVAPILQGTAGLESIAKVCGTLNRVGSTVNSDCGLHVHVGASHRDVNFFRNLAVLQHRFSDVIDSFMARSRRGNNASFAMNHSMDRVAMEAATTVPQVANAMGIREFNTYAVRSHWRYRKLNLLPFLVYGTVEFRQHQGTTDAKKIENWVRLCLRMTEKSAHTTLAEIDAAPQTLEGFMALIGASDEEIAFVNERRASFVARDAQLTTRRRVSA